MAKQLYSQSKAIRMGVFLLLSVWVAISTGGSGTGQVNQSPVLLEPFPGFQKLLKSRGFVMGVAELETSWKKDDRNFQVSIYPLRHLAYREAKSPDEIIERIMSIHAHGEIFSHEALTKINAKTRIFQGGGIIAAFEIPQAVCVMQIFGSGVTDTKTESIPVKAASTATLGARTTVFRMTANPKDVEDLSKVATHVSEVVKNDRKWIEGIQKLDSLMTEIGYERRQWPDPMPFMRRTPPWWKDDLKLSFSWRNTEQYAKAVRDFKIQPVSAANVNFENSQLERVGIKTFFMGAPSNIHCECKVNDLTYELSLAWNESKSHGNWIDPHAIENRAQFDKPVLDLFNDIALKLKKLAEKAGEAKNAKQASRTPNHTFTGCMC